MIALEEQFIYPRNKALKEAYIALLGMMTLEKKIRFSVYECARAIVERNGRALDYTPGDARALGPNYKKAVQQLRALENPFFRVAGALSIELCIYDAKTKRRITDFDTFFMLCSEDPHMSEYETCDQTVIFDDWKDPVTLNSNSDIYTAVEREIQLMDSAVPLKEDIIESSFETVPDKQSNPPERRG